MIRHAKLILETRKLKEEREKFELRTGVGTPDKNAEPAGAEVGADTGDVDLQYEKSTQKRARRRAV